MMAKELHCRDIGFDCDAVVTADTEEGIIQQVVQHAQEVHGLTDDQLAAPQLVERVHAQISDRDASV